MIEPGIYKDVMSSFPSGVTVVTALDPDGGIVALFYLRRRSTGTAPAAGASAWAAGIGLGAGSRSISARRRVRARDRRDITVPAGMPRMRAVSS